MADVNNKDKIEAVADSAGLWVNVADSAYSAIRVAIVSGGGGGGGAALTAGVSTMGNTLGNTGTVSNQVIFAGINGITLSQSTNAGGATVTISGPGAGGGAGFSAGASTGGNTLGSTGTVSGQFVFVGTNGITLSQSTNGGSATLTISGITQSTQPAINAFGVSNTGTTLGNTGTSSGITWVVAASGNITASQSTAGGGPNTVWLSVPAQTTQPAVNAFGVSNTGNTAGNTGTSSGITWVLGGSNALTLSQSTAGGGPNTVWVQGPASATTASQVTTINTAGTRGSRFALEDHQHIGVAALAPGSNTGNTAGNTATQPGGTWVIAGSGPITISGSTAAGGINTAWVQMSQTNQQMTMFATGNTTQSSTATTNASSLVFAGSGIASVGLSGGTVLISVPAGGGAGDGGVFAGVSTAGNTAGSTGTVSTGNFVFVGSNNITLSQSTGAAGSAATLTILGPTLYSAGVSTDGNTAGSTGMVSNRIVYVGSNGITLSQSTGGASSATITINGPQATLNLWNPYPGMGVAPFAMQNATLRFQPMEVEQFVSATVLRHLGSFSVSSSSNSSWGGTISIHYGIYTKNVSTMSLASSGSVTYAFTNTSSNSFNNLHGQRNFSVPINLSMTPGDYFVGHIVRTSTVNANSWTMSNVMGSVTNAAFSGEFMIVTSNSNQRALGLGIYSVSVSTLPTAVGFSELTGSGQSSMFSQAFLFGSL